MVPTSIIDFSVNGRAANIFIALHYYLYFTKTGYRVEIRVPKKKYHPARFLDLYRAAHHKKNSKKFELDFLNLNACSGI